MAVERFRLDLDSCCAECGTDLAFGQVAVWCAAERVIKCLPCAGVSDDSGVLGHPQRALERTSVGRRAAVVASKLRGARNSAVAPVMESACRGKQETAEVLEGIAGIEVLHDRRIPRTKAIIDHLIVAPAGVFVLGVHSGTGRVELRDRGGVLRYDARLFVNGRDRTSLADGVLDRMEFVRRVLDTTYPTVEVQGILCFVGCHWGVLMRPKHVHGVTAMWPGRLPDHVSGVGPFAALVPAVAYHLGEYLPSAV